MDIAHQETDKIIAKTEKLITKEYKKAHKEVSKKLDDYLARFATKDEKWQQWVASGKKTQAEYVEWKKGQILIGKRWEAMKNTLAADYANAAQISESIVNGYKSEVYALNHNYATFEVEKKSMIDTSYTLYSKEAVERMYRDNPRLYHQPGDKIKQAIKSGKQAAWDKRRIQSVMTQGVLQGDSIPNLTKRLEKVTGGDHKAAIRNARTMMTGVENAGRLDAIKRANELGIPTKKQWVATLDSRTRHWHRQLDGVIEEPEEPFVNQYGKIMFPGDPTANGANLYNCRCRIRSAVKGFERDMSNLDRRYNENLGDMDYETWKETRKSISHPITKQEDIGKSVRQAWWNVYAGHGEAKAPTQHKYTAKEGQQIIDNDMSNQVQRELDELRSIEYPDIWQNKIVTPADYPDMEKQIATKSRYLDKKIHESKVKNDTKALSKYQSQKESLLDFEKKGKRHQELTVQLHPEKDIKEKTKKVVNKTPKQKNTKTGPVKGIEKEKILDNNDTSGNINKTRFKRKNGSLDKDYVDVLENKYDKGTDIAKKVYDKYVPNGGAVQDLHHQGTAHHKNGSVFLDQDKDSKNVKGGGTTWFHEHGQYIDFKNGYKGRDSVDLQKAIRKDVKNYEKMMKQMLEKKTGFPMFTGDVRRAISREMRAEGADLTHSLQDIFGGAIKKPYPGAKYSHRQKYWEDRGDYGVSLEAFAHMFEASFDEKKKKLMKKYLPTAWKEFEKILGGML